MVNFHLNFATLVRLVLTLAASVCMQGASAQTLLDNLRASWQTYVVVSTHLPRRELVNLASEAQRAQAVLVLKGFDDEGRNDLKHLQTFIHDINTACCSTTPVQWLIHPILLSRYHVISSPAFIIALGESAADADFAVVSGDMTLANALKFFAQDSRNPRVREQASQIYQRAFAGSS